MNTFGRIFRVTTWGESHGEAIGCVVDGCPSGLELNRGDIQRHLDRRSPGKNIVSTERNESDDVEILSGVFEDKTLGTPISMLIKNLDVDSSRYEEIKNLLRPGHAEFTWKKKFGLIDWRGGGRASGRETASRVAAGAVARKLLKTSGVEILAYSKNIAGVSADTNSDLEKMRKAIDSNPVRSPDSKAAKKMEKAILSAREGKDSVGGVIEAVALGVPAGLGEPVFDKLDADLAKAMMSIPAVKGVEIGKGFELAEMRGSQANDAFILKEGIIQTETNNCGGILGGISNGMPIVVRVAVKPTSSIRLKQKTVDIEKMGDAFIEVEGRHDPCIVPRAVVVVESMLALVLADHSLITGLIPRKLI
jgi:chorismate synthase